MIEPKNFIEDIIVNDLLTGKRKNVITRFPPEPNGYLHIGHAKSLCINFGIKEKFKGKCNLRFDDTNPTKEDVEYVESIKEDIKWLGFEWDNLLFASDYFKELYLKAVTLIEKGLAYVCDLSPAEIREQRGTLTQAGVNSPYRERSKEENLKLFTQMKEGVFADGSKVLRAKIDMSSPNINMRDPVIYRILRSHHHRTGDKWCIYPMYDYAHPVSDAIEKITHSICTLEFEAHRPLYDWFVNHLDFPSPPQQIEFARLNIKNTIMSKRFLKSLVDKKVVDGWSDPRMPTLSGMRKRGIPKEAIKAFCAEVGVAKANSEVDSAMLDYFTRENLNKNALRAMVVEKPLEVIIDNWEKGKSVLFKVSNNPQDENAEARDVAFSGRLYIERDDFALIPPPKYKRLKEQGKARLWGAYIIEHKQTILDDEGNVIALHCDYIPDSQSGGEMAGVKVKGVIQWVDAEDNIDIDLYNYGDLLSEAKEDQNIAERINPNSLEIIKQAKGEGALRHSKIDQSYQFMRKAYYKREQSTSSAFRFNRIVMLKDNYNKK